MKEFESKRAFIIAAAIVFSIVLVTVAVGSTMIIGSQKGNTINNIQNQYNLNN